MSLMVVGTLAYDSVETPYGKADDVLGGAATYFSVAASFFTPVRLVGVVGRDFRAEDRKLLTSRGIDLEGLTVSDGPSFRWKGKYEGDMNVAETLETHLNVLDGYQPVLPDSYRDSKYVFLANSPPALQMQVLDQCGDDTFAACDTMNLWIQTAYDDLMELLKRVDMVICNDQEALSIAQDHSLIRAGRKLLEMGPRIALIKKGEHGAFLFGKDGYFYAIPAYPLEHATDPTGAGDSFAGGVMGWLASAGSTHPEHLKRAMIYGSVVASFNVEDFTLRRFRQIDRGDIDERYDEFLEFTAHP